MSSTRQTTTTNDDNNDNTSKSNNNNDNDILDVTESQEKFDWNLMAASTFKENLNEA